MGRKSDQLRKNYKGILNTPIRFPKPEPKPTILCDENTENGDQNLDPTTDNALKTEIVREAFDVKLCALFEHYEIDSKDRDCWKDLAIELATNHVKGFAIEFEGVAGKPKIWNDTLLAKLYFDVNEKLKNSPSINHACMKLLKSYPWSALEISSESLAKKYSVSKESSWILIYNNLPKNIRDNIGYVAMIDKLIKDTFKKSSRN